jgi:enediyne biosynthesis protein E4
LLSLRQTPRLSRTSPTRSAFRIASLILLLGQALCQAPPGTFVDVTKKLGVHFKQEASPTSKKYLPETMGSGVALFDYDNDGHLDIFFANGARVDDPTPKGTIPQKDNPKYWNRL